MWGVFFNFRTIGTRAFKLACFVTAVMLTINTAHPLIVPWRAGEKYAGDTGPSLCHSHQTVSIRKEMRNVSGGFYSYYILFHSFNINLLLYYVINKETYGWHKIISIVFWITILMSLSFICYEVIILVNHLYQYVYICSLSSVYCRQKNTYTRILAAHKQVHNAKIFLLFVWTQISTNNACIATTHPHDSTNMAYISSLPW